MEVRREIGQLSRQAGSQVVEAIVPPENITLDLERRNPEDSILESLSGEVVKIALHSVLADALTECRRVETEPGDHVLDHGKISEGPTVPPACLRQTNGECHSSLIVAKKAKRAQRLERAKRVLRRTDEGDSREPGVAQDIPVRIATLRRHLHRADQASGVQESSIDDGT